MVTAARCHTPHQRCSHRGTGSASERDRRTVERCAPASARRQPRSASPARRRASLATSSVGARIAAAAVSAASIARSISASGRAPTQPVIAVSSPWPPACRWPRPRRRPCFGCSVGRQHDVQGAARCDAVHLFHQQDDRSVVETAAAVFAGEQPDRGTLVRRASARIRDGAFTSPVHTTRPSAPLDRELRQHSGLLSEFRGA